jgi:hypothetical protein
VSSAQSEASFQPARIAELFSKCRELAAREEREMAKIRGAILPLLSYVEEPILLRPSDLGLSFEGLRSMTLQSGGRVVATDVHGLTASRSLDDFKSSECLAILKVALPEIKRLVAEKERAARVKPALSMKLTLRGQRRIFDTRSYHLVVLNEGGDCKSLSVSVGLSDGTMEPRKERDLDRGMRVELDLGKLFKDVEGLDRLSLRVECMDVDGREFVGVGSLPVDGTWHEQSLMKKSWVGPARRS